MTAHIPTTWQNGRRQPCTGAEFTKQLREFADASDDRHRFSSRGLEAHTGERMRAAADFIDWLVAATQAEPLDQNEIWNDGWERGFEYGSGEPPQPSKEDIVRVIEDYDGTLDDMAPCYRDNVRELAGLLLALLQDGKK